MREKGVPVAWLKHHLGEILSSLGKDRLWIIMSVVLFGLLGAVMGKLNTSVTSTAQLIVAPMPFRVEPTPDDAIARMLASPMDVKTVVILCTSDETFKTTLTRLQEAKIASQLIAPPKNLNQLRDMLSYEITIEKETPYDLEYSPVIKLTARAGKSADAKLLVNTWAKVCEKAAMDYQKALHLPATKIFNTETTVLFEEYKKAQEELAAFQHKNIVALYQARIASMVQNIADLDTSRAKILEAVNRAQADFTCNQQELSKTNSIDLYEKNLIVIEASIGKLNEERPVIEQEIDEAKQQLEWHEKMLAKESNLSLLQVRIAGLEESVEELEKQRPELAQKILSGQASVIKLEEELAQESQKLGLDWKASPEAATFLAKSFGGKSRSHEGASPLLEIEKLNENYIEIRGDLSIARVDLSADEAALENLDHLVETLKSQRDDIQLMLSEMDLSQERIQPVAVVGDALAEARLTFYAKEAALKRTDSLIQELTKERSAINTLVSEINVENQRMEPLSIIGKKLSEARLELATQNAALENTTVLRDQYTQELNSLQETLVLAQIKEENLQTDASTLGDAYANMLGKEKFAHIASELANSPQVQILFEGAEWRVPRFRYAIIGGFFAGLWGLFVGIALSLCLRLLLLPALKR